MGEKIAEFKVGNIIYDINLDEKIMASEQALGLCDYVNASISLYPNQNEQRMEQVMFHELLHAIFGEAGYDEQDEDMINRVGIVFYQFIQDNFEYIGHPGVRKSVRDAKRGNAEAERAYAEDAPKLHAHPVGFDLTQVITGPMTEDDEYTEVDDDGFLDTGEEDEGGGES